MSFNKDLSDDLALELTCPICLLLFNQPVSLPCGHIYCLACLQAMGEGIDQHRCPECQVEYQETENLVRNFKMCSIVERYKTSVEKTVHAPGPSDSADLHKPGQSQEENETLDELTVGSELLLGEKEGSKANNEMKEPKFKLASQVTELHLKLEMADSVLKKEKELELEVITANSYLRETTAKLLGQIKDLAQRYGDQVTQMVEEELGPSEASAHRRVGQATEVTKELRQTVLRAESLLTEEDETAFNEELSSLQPYIMELLAKPEPENEDCAESRINPGRACSKLENMNDELRKSLAEVQRSLRNSLNPSEVTFDPETAHPNLLLSDDLKTVTFSPVKQPYPSCPQRFTSFFQVLSTQSFFGGEHSWEVELEGSPWIVGVCCSEKLARCGLPSALESSRSSWCLMWFNNLLTAFEQSHGVPLKKTTVSRRLEIKLSFKTHRLSFYNISPTTGKTHIYTFKAKLTEPVHVAYRMMSGHPKARVTICS
ncbi:E3 ubiquitin-protein ligase TRIM39 [Oryzias melastigma]|uniref:E3 ubiquitin-protein ligase TRIM39 n=1 Tax=Oryzias melastigma TaxID=30732 RepID=A0A834CM59_ORYME|nr:E3 ubiquitin-protein ligase TRIM39 [Oryzias melastigma]